MKHYNNIEAFAIQFQQEIIAEASIKDIEKFHEQVFVDLMLNDLYEAGEIENGIRCQHKSTGIKIDGYDFNEELLTLDIFVACYFSDNIPPLPIMGKTDIDIYIKRALTFFQRSGNKKEFLDALEDSAEIRDLSLLIYKEFKNIRKLRIILLTNGIIKNYELKNGIINNTTDINYQVWDIQRLYRFHTSGIINEPIHVDFKKHLGKPIDCIIQKDTLGLYDTYLAIIPGGLLASLYNLWDTKLLEKNVRSYLQAQNKKSVNYGIKETLKVDGNMFLAYNNGITVTAESVVLQDNENKLQILSVNDFQIVNGGQTTASLWHVHYREKHPLEGVYVQMKLTVINDSSEVDKITPLISKYSNSQNKVNTADFSANDPFHRELEKLSRSIWAPDPQGGNKQTKWFYERASGSFYEIRNHEEKEKDKRVWDTIHLRNQKFDKTFLAKVEKTWLLHPFDVSLGAQKNFSRFSLYLKENNIIHVDDIYFKRLVSKIIIWKTAEQIIAKHKIPGYRANIIAYTLSYIVYKTSNKIDLLNIWEKQEVGKGLAECIDLIGRHVREHIMQTNENVTEYCKKEKCWQRLLETNYSLPISIELELVDTSYKAYIKPDLISPQDDKNLDFINAISAQTWKHISRWGSLTNSLEKWENGICYSIGNLLTFNKKPSVKQAIQGKKIYQKAIDRGFIEQSLNEEP